MKVENSCEDCVFCETTSTLECYKNRDETIFADIKELPQIMEVNFVEHHCSKHNKETFTDFTCDDFINKQNGGIQ